MRFLIFKSSLSASSPSPFSLISTLTEAIMEETMETAMDTITKWQSYETSADYCPNTSLFNHHSREEVLEFMRAIKDLQASLQFLTSVNSSSKKLVTAQNLLRVSMKRLGREFFSLLKTYKLEQQSSDSHSLSSNSDDYDCVVFTREIYDGSEEASAIDNLKLIADCMMSAGYAKKCLKIYKLTRRSIVEEAIMKLGVRKLKKSQVVKMDWEAIEEKIKKWLNSISIGVKQVFRGERVLCDHLFPIQPAVRELCFAEVCRDSALMLFRIPGKLAKHSKKSPERLFKYLDLFVAISDLSPEIDVIFSFDSTAIVRSQARSSVTRITDAVRLTLTEFESSIQKDASKTLINGGGIHPLTRYVMNYIYHIKDFVGALDMILADWPVGMQSPALPESYFDSESPTSSPVTLRLAWIMLITLCKLDAKSEQYKDPSLSNLFLANNLQYVVSKVTGSTKLRSVLGEKWVAKHAAKVVQYAANYERTGWDRVIATLPAPANDNRTPVEEIPIDKVRRCFKRFNAEFEEEYRKQVDWVVLDQKLREKIKSSVTRKVSGRYREMYDKYRDVLAKHREKGVIETVIKFTPEDLENYLSDLLDGPEPDDVVPSSGEYHVVSPSGGTEGPGVQGRRKRLLLLLRQQHHQ